jgi:hypothetical protein
VRVTHARWGRSGDGILGGGIGYSAGESAGWGLACSGGIGWVARGMREAAGGRRDTRRRWFAARAGCGRQGRAGAVYR